jgi:hypothetical protein
VLYLYMDAAQKALATHPVSRVFFWRRSRGAMPSGVHHPADA